MPILRAPGSRSSIPSFYDPNYGISRLAIAIKSLDQEFQARKTELQRLQRRIEQLSNLTGETAQTATPATARTKLSQPEQLKKDLQLKAEDAEGEYSKRLRESLNPIFEDPNRAIKTFAQQHRIALIFNGSKLDGALLYITESLD